MVFKNVCMDVCECVCVCVRLDLSFYTEKIPYEKLVKYLLKITRLLMKSGSASFLIFRDL